MYSNQQGNLQQGQGQFSQSQQQFQPQGFVQSRYQGQMSQPTFNRSPQSTMPSGMGFMNQSQFQPLQSTQAGRGFVQAQTQPNPVNSHFRTNQGPVISQLGYQSGTQSQNQPLQSQFQQPIQSQFGASGFSGQSAQSSQPVISRLGFQAGPETRNPVLQATSFGQQQPISGGFGQMGGQTGFSQATTPQNPVYQATNARQQDGPVIAKLGYTNATGGQF